MIVGKSKKDQGLELLKKAKRAKLEENNSVTTQQTTSSTSQLPVMSASPSQISALSFPVQQHNTPVKLVKGHTCAIEVTNGSKVTFGYSQRQMEYFQFMSQFPKLLPCDKNRLKSEVENVLGFEDFKDAKACDWNFENCVQGTPLLNAFSISSGMSLK